jgi:hypothetical protein
MQILRRTKIFCGSSRRAELWRGWTVRNANARIDLVEIGLEAPFCIFRGSVEFNPHANARVASSHTRGGGYMFLIDPEIDSQNGRDGQWHGGFNVTAVAADIGGIHAHGSVDAFVAKLQGKSYSVALVFAAIVGSGRAYVGTHLDGQLGEPGTFLVSDQLHPNLHLLQAAGFEHPDDFAASFFALVLNADDVADFHRLLEAVDAGPRGADVLRGRVLMEWLIVRTHPPYAQAQF